MFLNLGRRLALSWAELWKWWHDEGTGTAAGHPARWDAARRLEKTLLTAGRAALMPSYRRQIRGIAQWHVIDSARKQKLENEHEILVDKRRP